MLTMLTMTMTMTMTIKGTIPNRNQSTASAYQINTYATETGTLTILTMKCHRLHAMGGGTRAGRKMQVDVCLVTVTGIWSQAGKGERPLIPCDTKLTGEPLFDADHQTRATK